MQLDLYGTPCTRYCSVCACLGNVTNYETINALVGNSICNDETNNLKCNYDHGDCCLSNVNMDTCSDCMCSSNGLITSPNFPNNYDNNLDLTWLIQLPLGQTIEITFLSFFIAYEGCNSTIGK